LRNSCCREFVRRPTRRRDPQLVVGATRQRQSQDEVGPAANRAIEACRAANNGNLPQREQALLPYFATPQEGADFVEFLEAQKAAGSH
jgi:hypothetical protein